jgi:hypothetical protein
LSAASGSRPVQQLRTGLDGRNPATDKKIAAVVTAVIASYAGTL